MAAEDDFLEVRQPPWRAATRRLLHHRLFLLGLILFGMVAIVAILAPWIAPQDPNKLAMRFKFRPPDRDFLFGTDNFGRSLWSRVIWGARLSMLIGSSVVLINAVCGTAIGAAAGYFRQIDNVLMRVNDALMAFPAVLLAIAVTAVLGPSVNDVIIALGIVYTPRTARIVRSSVIVLREMDNVQAAVAAGGGHWRILRRHILPNALHPALWQPREVFAAEPYGAGSDPGRGARQQTHDRQSGDALAAAGLPHDAQHFPFGQIEADVFHRRDLAPAGAEHGREIAHFKQAHD